MSNSYSLFAELVTNLISNCGRTSLILPTGIATDESNKFFIQNIVNHKYLVSFFDFTNRGYIFQGTESTFSFALLTLSKSPISKIKFSSQIWNVEQLKDSNRVIKKDMELVRKLLLEIESRNSGYAPINIVIDGYTQEQIRYHAFIMMEGGLIEGIDRTDLDSKSPQAIPRRLTWSGHEFLDNARNDTVWKKAMSIVQEKGGTIGISVLSQLLSSLMKAHFGLP